ncbi:MAG: mreC [Alphaproteobacteria bacterium]|nr:mreC [Alphaproteobacteria bacterium]
MAPPKTRRPGFSRKAQYGLFLGYVVAVAGIIFAALLLLVAIVDPAGFNALKGAALDVTTPVASGGRNVVRFFGGIGDTIGNYFMAGSENAGLKRELAASRRKLIEAQAIEHDNQRLKALLGITRSASNEVAIGRIVGSSFDTVHRLATMSIGGSSGVRPGLPVRSADGLVGRVIETGRWASRILLLTDGASNVPVRLVRDGTPAIATGRGDGGIELKTLEVGRNPFRRGDILVTSGVGGIYPPDIPVARVVAVQGERAIALPIADPASLDYAVVLKAYQPLADLPLTPATAAALQGAGQ